MLATNLKNTVSADLDKVNKLIKSSLYSKIDLVQDIGNHIIDGGGKRLRPILALLSAKACGYSGNHHITIATVIEFIHAATLLHDDVIDNSTLRREAKTANHIWGNQSAVLVGDFLYSRAFQLMIEVQNINILGVIANATNTIAEGEVLQLLNHNNPATSEQTYLQIIRNKTAKLFEAAAEIGAILSASDQYTQNALAQFGLHIGTAYQLIDDVLDYKDDLVEGNNGMPLIHLLQHGSTEHKALAISAIENKDCAVLAQLEAAIVASGSLDYTLEFAKREATLAKQALSELPPSIYREAAQDLAEFVITRNN